MPGPNSPYTSLDANQVLKQSFNEATDRLRVDAGVTISGGEMEVAISDTEDSIRIGNGLGNKLAINSDGSINVQSIGLDTVTIVQSSGSNLHVDVDNFPTTQAVTQSGIWNINNISGTISLPTGASTSAKQDATNTSLSSIDTKIPSLGQALAASCVPVVLTSSQLTTLTPLTTIGVTQNTSPWVNNISQFGGSNIVTGTGNSGSGIPRVTISNDSSITNISGTISLPTGAATSSNQTNGNQITQVSSLPSIPSGTNTIGAIFTVPSIKSTYAASGQTSITVTTPTDVATITGSNTKTIHINRVRISGVETTTGQHDILLVKRSSPNTGGTATTLNIVPYDSNNSAATATVVTYSGASNPILGTSVGNIRFDKFTFPTGTGVNSLSPLEHTFGDKNNQSIVLRGTSQQLSINFNGSAVTGGTIDVMFEWTEE